MNSSFPNRWSFSYLKFTKYVTNIIAEPKHKHRHQEQVRSTTEAAPWNGQYKNTGGLKPVLRVPNRSNRHGLLARISLGWWTIFSGLRSCTVHILNLNIARSQYAITYRTLALSNTCLISRDTLFEHPFYIFFRWSAIKRIGEIAHLWRSP